MIQDGELEPLNMVSHRVLLEELDIVYKKFDSRMEVWSLEGGHRSRGPPTWSTFGSKKSSFFLASEPGIWRFYGTADKVTRRRMKARKIPSTTKTLARRALP